MDINVLLFNDFEALDAFGPVEVLSISEKFALKYYSPEGGAVTSVQGMQVLTEPISAADKSGILLVPGGAGTRTLIHDEAFLAELRALADASKLCLSVCTGSVLLAKCGALDGKKATSNKQALEWVKTASDKVQWIDRARWVVDGKFYTASGVSAGMDMAMGFVSDYLGSGAAEETAEIIEYIWNDNPAEDPFAK